jgi:drug/metabolite transporter (DMT)-like permease
MTLTLVDGTAFFLCLIFVPFLPVPSTQVWLFIAMSVVLNTIYRLLLVKAYDTGDFGQVYPIVRGVPPVIVAIAAAVFLAEELSFNGYLGVALISLGIISLTIVRNLNKDLLMPIAMACAAGVFIAGYTIVDALGVRASDTVFQFIIYLTVFQSIPMPALAWARNSKGFRAHIRSHWKSGAMGGVAYLASYGLVLYAFSVVPVAKVSALRETSVIIAAAIASLFFKEPVGLRRFFAAALVCAGIMLIKTTD